MLNKKLIDNLIEQAKNARLQAYAPYSNFKVGCAVLLEPNHVITGCNIENASFSLTICAERVAYFNAINQFGMKYVKDHLELLILITDTPQLIVPCGACLQTLSELDRDIEIFVANVSGKTENYKFQDLMPLSFQMKKKGGENSPQIDIIPR